MQRELFLTVPHRNNLTYIGQSLQVLACNQGVVRVKMKMVGNLRVKIMATGRPTRFKWQHTGSVTHSTLLHMHSKLVVLGE